MPDGTSRFSYKGQAIAHYMGCSTFSNFTVLPEIAVAKIRKDAPFDKACYVGCGVTTGVGAVVNTAKVEPGANCVVFGLGGIGLNVIQGLKMVGTDMIVVRIEQDREQTGVARAADVHRHRIADVRHSRPIDVGQRSQSMIEDPGIGFGHAHDVTVDHHAHRHAGTITDLAHAGTGEHRFDLSGRVAHHADGDSSLMERP